MEPGNARVLARLRRKLLTWFDAHRRDLPWRTTRDPYPIWVSEVMLQQTTVAAVVPFFERFLAAFPTLPDLAAADEQTVLRQWAGLGYYRRARHLHASAKRIVAEHGGRFPDDPDLVADLPGVGRYILGAVLSQAFDRKLPIVEANSLRVLSRWFAYPGDPRVGEGKKWVWSAAEMVLPEKRVGDFNQAMMELGSQVCTPTRPRCEECPVSAECLAFRNGLQLQIPPPPAAKEITPIQEVAVIVRDGAKILLCQRPELAKRWAGMWEVPHAERLPEESDAVAALRICRELTGFEVAPGNEILTIRHAVTRFAITMVCVEAALVGGIFHAGVYRHSEWVTVADLDRFPVSSPQRRMMQVLHKLPASHLLSPRTVDLGKGSLRNVNRSRSRGPGSV